MPAGVKALTYRSTPKLTSTPSFDSATRVLTWSLNTAVHPRKSVKVTFKMQPTACTTPSVLSLNGQFTFTGALGTGTVDACLKKPVSMAAPASVSRFGMGCFDLDAVCPPSVYFIPRLFQPASPPPKNKINPVLCLRAWLCCHPQGQGSSADPGPDPDPGACQPGVPESWNASTWPQRIQPGSTQRIHPSPHTKLLHLQHESVPLHSTADGSLLLQHVQYRNL